MEVESSRYTEKAGEISEECCSREEGVQMPSPSTACFDCNICLDFVVDPVVTLCGHLYCWRCVYRWMQSDRDGSRQCPVCKAPVSENCLVPLYGRGLAMEEGPCKTLEIPSRPPVVRERTRIAARVENQPMHHHHQNQYHYYAGPDYRYGGPVFRSTAGCLLGGMAVAVLPWFSRDNEAALYNGGLYDIAASGRGGRRPSRRQMQLIGSLQQIWMFLFICTVVFFILF